jgi:hypothetical protein
VAKLVHMRLSQRSSAVAQLLDSAGFVMAFSVGMSIAGLFTIPRVDPVAGVAAVTMTSCYVN